MADLVDAGAAEDFAEGTMKAVAVDGRDLLVVRAGDSFHVVDDRCPHMGSRLSPGRLEGTVVTCPWHGSRFDVSDGRVIQWTDRSGVMLKLAKIFKSPTPLKVYPARVVDGRLLVQVN